MNIKKINLRQSIRVTVSFVASYKTSTSIHHSRNPNILVEGATCQCCSDTSNDKCLFVTDWQRTIYMYIFSRFLHIWNGFHPASLWQNQLYPAQYWRLVGLRNNNFTRVCGLENIRLWNYTQVLKSVVGGTSCNRVPRVARKIVSIGYTSNLSISR